MQVINKLFKSAFIAGFFVCQALVIMRQSNSRQSGSLSLSNATAARANAKVSIIIDNRRGPTREEFERDKSKYEREARKSGRTVGTGPDDLWLWVKTRSDLGAADDLPDSRINVDVDHGTVTLTGTVASAAQKANAEEIVKSVEGVKVVKNRLTVRARQ
jgi:hypothetical protein